MANPCTSTPQLLLLLAVVVGVLDPNKAWNSRDTGVTVPYYATLALQVVLGSSCYSIGTPALLSGVETRLASWRDLSIQRLDIHNKPWH